MNQCSTTVVEGYPPANRPDPDTPELTGEGRGP